MSAAQYEIEIYNADETDMAYTIVRALLDADVQGDDRDEIGMYLREGKANSVFVDPSDVAKAVQAINALGFETDEDSNEVETTPLDDYFAMVMDELGEIVAQYPSVEAFVEAEFNKAHSPELGDFYPEGTASDMVAWIKKHL